MVFTPTDYPGLLGWYKADAITPVADGTAISSWGDSGPLAVALAQADGAKQPVYKVAANGINGLPVVQFDGSNDCLTRTLDCSKRMSVTVYAVLKPANLTQSSIVAELTANSTTTGGFTCTQEVINGFNSFLLSGSLSGGTVSNFVAWQQPTTNATIVTYRYGRALRKHQCAVFVNGDNRGGQTVDNQNGGGRFLVSSTLNVGARNNGASAAFAGDFGELLIFGNLHTPDQRMVVEAYLSERWGITVVESEGCAVFSGHSEVDGDGPNTKRRVWWRRSLDNVNERIDWLCNGKNGSTTEKFADQRYPRAMWVENTLPVRLLSSHGPDNDLNNNFGQTKTQFNEQQNWDDLEGTNATHIEIATAHDRSGVGKHANFETDRAVVNPWILANAPASFIITDLGSDTQIGTAGSSPGDYFATDGDHLSDPKGEAYVGRLFTEKLVTNVGLTRFSPSQVSGLILWIDAAQLTGLNDGDLVSSWTDLSGQGNHATASGATRPTYNTNQVIPNNAGTGTSPAITFGGSQELLTGNIDLTGTQALTVFVIGTAADDLANHIWWAHQSTWFSGTTGAAIYRKSDKKLAAHLNGNVGLYSRATTNNVTTTPTMMATIFDKSQSGGSGATTELIANAPNGTFISNSGSANNTNAFANAPMGIGGHGGTNLTGIIAEVLVYNRRLTLSEFRRVESHLGTKYGLY